MADSRDPITDAPPTTADTAAAPAPTPPEAAPASAQEAAEGAKEGSPASIPQLTTPVSSGQSGTDADAGAPASSPEHTAAVTSAHPSADADVPATDPKSLDATTQGLKSPAAPSPTELTPLRAHYLKKALVELEFAHEIGTLSSAVGGASPVAFLGPPFAPPPRGTPAIELPFLRYAFRTLVLPFPFLAAAPRDFFPDKLQPFLGSLLARNISSTNADVLDADPEATETAMRARVRHKLERNLALFLGSTIKLAEREEVVRLHQTDLDRLEEIAQRRQAREHRGQGYVFEVNVVCVRTVVERMRMRSKTHEEFIIRTRRSDEPDVFVARRYGDFGTLAQELRKAHPDAMVPPPPKKDKSQVNMSSAPTSPNPLVRTQTTSSISSTLSTDSAGGTRPAGGRLAREKNRLTLRAYLRVLLASGTLASSPVLQSFLLAEPTTLGPDELADARRREEADRLRDEGRRRFARELAARVDGLRGALRSVKGDMMGQDGLTHIFSTIKATTDVRQLPSEYQAVLEWARVSLASTIFQTLVASDDASETLTGLKRIHGLMPYFMLRTALKISNPVTMIRNILDLFMAQPFGKQSLLQRMFTSSLQEEVRALEEDIEAVEDKIDDPVICEKVRLFAYAPKEIQSLLRADAESEKLNVLAVVLRSGDAPTLSRPQMQRVMRSHRAHVTYMRQRARLTDSDDDDGPEDEDAWLFEDLAVLTKLYGRLRDRQQIIELIFEGTTADLLKDIITIFYAPLAQVYKAANIADSISDLQTFINDLIRTVEQVDETTQADPMKTVKVFLDLVQRHEQAFYMFVHNVHSKGESLFDSLMRWIERFLTLAREGISPEPVALEFLLPHVGNERIEILAEVDTIARYHYKLKVAHEERVRRRFGRTQDGPARAVADAEDAAAQALVAGVVDELSFGELVQGDALDTAAADSESENDESDDSSYEEDSEDGYETAEESGTHATPARKSVDVPHPRRKSVSGQSLRKSRSQTLSHTPQSPSGPVPPMPSVPQSAKQSTFSMFSSKTRSPATPTSPGASKSPTTPSRASQDNSRRRSLSANPASKMLKSKKRRPRQEEIKAPELVHIPNLLPVFLELLRPGLERQPQ